MGSSGVSTVRVDGQAVRRGGVFAASVAVAIFGAAVAACSGASSVDLYGADGPDAAPDAGVDAGDSASPKAPDAMDATGDAPTTTGAGDAKVDYTPDPCPPTLPSYNPISYNCSSTCGGGGLGPCSDISCHADWEGPSPRYMKNVVDGEIIRTPDKPGQDPKCALACDNDFDPHPSPFAFAMAFSAESSSILRIRVAPPWYVTTLDGPTARTFCPNKTTSKFAAGCVAGETQIVVWTSDPNAPARNVYVESVKDTKTACDGY